MKAHDDLRMAFGPSHERDEERRAETAAHVAAERLEWQAQEASAIKALQVEHFEQTAKRTEVVDKMLAAEKAVLDRLEAQLAAAEGKRGDDVRQWGSAWGATSWASWRWNGSQWSGSAEGWTSQVQSRQGSVAGSVAAEHRSEPHGGTGGEVCEDKERGGSAGAVPASEKPLGTATAVVARTAVVAEPVSSVHSEAPSGNPGVAEAPVAKPPPGDWAGCVLCKTSTARRCEFCFQPVWKGARRVICGSARRPRRSALR